MNEKERIQKIYEDTVLNEKAKGKTPMESLRNITHIIKLIEKSQGYKEDMNSEWLGPWLNDIKDEVEKLQKKMIHQDFASKRY